MAPASWFGILGTGWRCAALPRPHDKAAAVPDRSRLYADMAKLFLQDLANVEAGIYPLPFDHDDRYFHPGRTLEA
jgi:hypothetical protein